MRKLADAQSFLYYLEDYRQTYSILYFVDYRLVCTPEYVQRCFINFHLEDK